MPHLDLKLYTSSLLLLPSTALHAYFSSTWCSICWPMFPVTLNVKFPKLYLNLIDYGNTKKSKVIYNEYTNILEFSVCLHIQLFSGFLSHWTDMIDTVASHAPKAKAFQPHETLYIGQPQYKGASTISKQVTQLDTQTTTLGTSVSNATPPHDGSQTTASDTQLADSGSLTTPQPYIQAQDIAHVHILSPIYDLQVSCHPTLCRQHVSP